MAKIQVIMALTLDGFLPHEDEMLMAQRKFLVGKF